MDARLGKNRGGEMSKFTWKKVRVILLVLAALLIAVGCIYWLVTGRSLDYFWIKLLCVCYGSTWVMEYMEYVDALAANNQAISKRLDDLAERLERIEERLDEEVL
jgi:hypothetical protein